ncbi:MAG: Apolipoprotein N-acyltransferase [Phycisphaerae bacterium]|nr:Apolipoprotein N-acyltransferase [Phycisphaerae bacterium]
MSRAATARREPPRSTQDVGRPAQGGESVPALPREAVVLSALMLLHVVLMTPISAPRGWWPLAFVCLTPWCVAAAWSQRAWLFHVLSYLAGSAYFLVNLTWMMPVTGLGYIALAFYLGVYWLLAGWAVRTAQRRGVPLVVSVPVVWIGCEYLRAVALTGFPWLFISHAFYRVLPLIQVSDLVGAYGVSFVVVMVNASLARVALHRLSRRQSAGPRGPLVSVIAAAVLLIATLSYGWYQLSAAALTAGPRVAVVQADFPLRNTPPYSAPGPIVFGRYLQIAALAAAERPDLLVLPETVWNSVQNLAFLENKNITIPGQSPSVYAYSMLCHEATAAFCRGDLATADRTLAELLERWVNPARVPRRNGVPEPLPRLAGQSSPPVCAVIGSMAIDPSVDAAITGVRKYNSALVYDADGVQRPQRYDKTHLVPFGEVVPFRGTRLHWLYAWLNRLSPFSGADGTYEYSMTSGAGYTVFSLNTPQGVWRFGTPICYEDVMPYVCRGYAWDGATRRVDFLVNISNDGWFLHSAELPQHLAICVFRAVENRVGIARSVNTGISAFIDPNGRIRALVQRDGVSHGPGIEGFAIEPVWIDTRASLYGRFGDWFAQSCLLLSVVTWIGSLAARVARRFRTARAGRAADASPAA